MIKFEYNNDGCIGEKAYTTITKTIVSTDEMTWDEVAEHFKAFLQNLTYVFPDGYKLGLVHENEKCNPEGVF